MSQPIKQLALQRETVRKLTDPVVQEMEGGVSVGTSIATSVLSSVITVSIVSIIYSRGTDLPRPRAPGATPVTCAAISGCPHWYTCNPNSGPSGQSSGTNPT